jgi:hypothetical protein
MVIFFGGYGFGSSESTTWTQAAKASPDGRNCAFRAEVYPAKATADESSALREGESAITRTVQEIEANPDRPFIIVGHSSGAALAARVIERVRDSQHLKLIILDDGVDEGFHPPPSFQPATQMACWSARGESLVSFNQKPTKQLCANYHEATISGCNTQFCLHFRLVNSNALPALASNAKKAALRGGYDFKTAGYSNFSINLNWLDHSWPLPAGCGW